MIKGDNINSVNTKAEDNNDCAHVAMMVLMKTMTTMIMMKIVSMMNMLSMIVRIGVAISIPGGCTHVGPSSSSVNNEHQQNKELITITRTTFTFRHKLHKVTCPGLFWITEYCLKMPKRSFWDQTRLFFTLLTTFQCNQPTTRSNGVNPNSNNQVSFPPGDKWWWW